MIIKQLVTSVFLYIILLIAAADAQQDSRLNILNRDYDQVHIALHLTPNWEHGQISCTEYFTFTPIRMNFDTLRLHSIDSEFRSVKLDTADLSFRLRDSILYIVLPKNANPGDTITLCITFTATPTSGLYFFTPGSENVTTPFQIWSQGQGEENRHWYPAYDKPDDRLTTEIWVTVADKFTVISNGELRKTEKLGNGNTRWHWKMDESHVNYLTTLVIGEYEQITDIAGKISLDYYMPRDWVKQTNEVFGRTPAMLQFFSAYFGAYPYKRYSQIPVYDFLYGGMENVTATTLNRRLLHSDNVKPNYNSDDLIAHEFAHQWFGDLITCNTWEHAWLNEGFATYGNHLFNENYYGKDFFKAGMYSTFSGYLQNLISAKWNDTSAEAKSKLPKFRGLWHYGGGASVLHMLRYELGDATFRHCMQQYVTEYAHTNVITEDLIRSFTKSSGRDLRWFFDQWVYSYRFPDLITSYSYDADKGIVSLTVEQLDTARNSDIFSLRLPVSIVLNGSTVDTVMMVKERSTTLMVALGVKPVHVIFNPSNTVLCRLSETLPAEDNLKFIATYDEVPFRLRMAEKLPYSEKTLELFSEILFKDPSPFVRMKIIERLYEWNTPAADLSILYALNDEDPRVKELLFKRMRPRYPVMKKSYFLDYYHKEKNDYVKAAILYAYGNCNPDVSIAELIQLGNVTSHWNVVRRSVMEIAKNRKATDPVVLETAGEWVSYDMSTGDMHQLEESVLEYADVIAVNNPAIVTHIVSRGLHNPYFKVRNQALSIIKRHKLVEFTSKVTELAKSDRRQVVRYYLNSALQELQK